jgi:hypothetical protein
MDCIVTEIQIEAPLFLVWQVLTDFKAYSQWNPFILDAIATFQVGRQIEYVCHIPEGATSKVQATFTQIEAGHRFRWRNQAKFPFLLEVEHFFSLEGKGDTTTRFIQGQDQTGLCVSLLNALDYFEKPLQGYVAMNFALKSRCENLHK